MDLQDHLIARFEPDHGYPEETVAIAVMPPALGISQDFTTKTDKASGIINDANDYAFETMGDPA